MPKRAILPLDARFLPEKTRSLFDRLIEEPLMRGMTLVGGSALALQIGHHTYALAKHLNLPLFFQGTDFENTDIKNAMRALGYQMSEKGVPMAHRDIQR